MMNILGKYKNFFRIISLTKTKTDKIFMDAMRSFKLRTDRETLTRGTLHWKEFSKMFPLRWSIGALLFMSFTYRMMLRYKI